MFRSAANALVALRIQGTRNWSALIDLRGDVCGNGISKLVFTILFAVAENASANAFGMPNDTWLPKAFTGAANCHSAGT
jgi:hypothetical protein